MRSSRPSQLEEREEVLAALHRVFWIMALVVGSSVLMAGLFTLTAQPLLGALMVIVAMSALLYSGNSFCLEPGASKSIPKNKNNKEDGYGAEKRHREV